MVKMRVKMKDGGEREYELTPYQADALWFISLEDEGLEWGDLLILVGCAKGTLSQALRRLERLGLITREAKIEKGEPVRVYYKLSKEIKEIEWDPLYELRRRILNMFLEHVSDFVKRIEECLKRGDYDKAHEIIRGELSDVVLSFFINHITVEKDVGEEEYPSVAFDQEFRFFLVRGLLYYLDALYELYKEHPNEMREVLKPYLEKKEEKEEKSS
ncbi:MAG: hypothetical protein J7J99_06290 [Thermoprotei archaeon]|nr:hypothetical protein [Thermoprotei archaeon]